MRSRPKIKIDGKFISTHRHVWAQANGPVPEGWEVHHVDLDRFNNELANLVAMPAAEHRLLHSRLNQKHPIDKECVVCSKTFRPHPTHRKRAKVCSPACKSILTSRQKTAHNPLRRISPEMSRRIRERVAAGERPTDMATEYGVTKATITYHIQKAGPA